MNAPYARVSQRFAIALLFGQMVLAAMPVMASGILAAPVSSTAAAPSESGFTYLGTGTKWEPGPNTASDHTFTAPDGPRTPGGATFSIVSSGRRDASGSDTVHGSNRTRSITALDVPGLNTTDDYAGVFNWALDSWAAVSGFSNLGLVEDGNVDVGVAAALGGHLGDIRIAAWEISSSATLARGFQPGTEAVFDTGGTLSGDIHFDISRIWLNTLNDVGANGDYDFQTIALHEIGHALGLGHSSDNTSVMSSTYRGSRRTLGSDDVAGIQALYGVPVPEPCGALLVIVATGLLAATRRTLHLSSDCLCPTDVGKKL